MRPIPTNSDSLLFLFVDRLKYTFTDVLRVTFESIGSIPSAVVEETIDGNWKEIALPGLVQVNYQSCIQGNNSFKTTFAIQKKSGRSSELIVYQDLSGERTTELNKW